MLIAKINCMKNTPPFRVSRSDVGRDDYVVRVEEAPASGRDDHDDDGGVFV